MKKRQVKPKTKIFVQTHGTYPNETLVCVGGTLADAIKYAKRIKAKKGFIEWLETCDREDKENQATPSQSGYVRYLTDKGFTFMWLKPFEDTWDFWETLIHELSHLVDFVLTEQKRMGKETEARAYHLEYLFREIRRELQA